VTMHDAGKLLNPALVDGQIRGGFANALGAVLGEEFAYGADGSFLSGTFADYPVPTACEVPEPVILHMETPSPFTPLGAKGVGEGNCMSTPVCLANAVADALGVVDIRLPLTPSRVGELIFGEEAPPPKTFQIAKPRGEGRGVSGTGEALVGAPPQKVWDLLMDPTALASVLPGCDKLELTGINAYRAEMRIGVGPVRGRYAVRVSLSDLDPPHALTLSGDAEGALGMGAGAGRVTLEPTEEGTRVRYSYEATIGGKVAAVGGRMLDGAARVIIAQFFERLIRQLGGGKPSWWSRLSGRRQ
jgi:2-furoyl-CoA dehydrogenase large subunit